MSLIPVPLKLSSNLLLVCTNEIESILVSVAIARSLDRQVSRLFFPMFGLGRLAEVPAFGEGRVSTVLLNFPTPELARDPDAVRKVLKQADDLTWITEHPITPDEVRGRAGLKVVRVRESLRRSAAQTLKLHMQDVKRIEGVLAGLHPPFKAPEDAPPDLRWRYQLEAAKNEPFFLGPNSQGLIKGEEPEQDLVTAGYELLLQRMQSAEGSSFYEFEIPFGRGVMVPAPRMALGYYLDMAREIRRHKGLDMCVVSYDSDDPIIVEYTQRPQDLDVKMDVMRSKLARHTVLGFGPSGMAIKGPDTGKLEVIEKVLEVLRTQIH